MINSVNVPAQTVAVNSPVLFASDRVKTGCSVRHEAGSSRFVITKPGIYKVTFGATFSATTAGTAVFNIMQDGEQVPAAQVQAGVGTATDIETCSVTTLIKNVGCSTAISVNNVGTIPVSVVNASVVIDRLC